MFHKKIIELSHVIHPSSPVWDGGTTVTMPLVCDYDDCTTTSKVRVHELVFKSGAGTHVDAPAHFIRGGRTIDQLRLDELVAPCIVIDVHANITENSVISLGHVQAFEVTHKPTFAGSIAFFRTDWSTKWTEPERYRNDLKFPTLHEAAAQYLINQGVLAIGIDTLSPDAPGDWFAVHEIVLGADRYLIENVTNLDQMPPTGATVMVMPIPVAGATESPARIIGLI
jgi:kynurenine formamidase